MFKKTLLTSFKSFIVVKHMVAFYIRLSKTYTGNFFAKNIFWILDYIKRNFGTNLISHLQMYTVE